MYQFRKDIFIVAVLLVIALIVVVGFFDMRHRTRPPHVPTPDVNLGGHKFMLQSAKKSQELMLQGVAFLKARDVQKAENALREAIRVFPVNSEAYAILVKFYLMLGKEQELYKTLELTGFSYPAFDNILSVVNDEDLARIPLPAESADVFIAPFRGNKKMAVSFMFDDGETSVYTTAMPEFEKHGYRATVSLVGAQVALQSTDPYRGSWQQWRDAADRGFEIASHSMNHFDAKNLNPKDYAVEIDQAKDMIEKNVGKKVFSYVFPLDSYSDPVRAYVLKTHSVVREPDFLRTIYGRSMVIMYGGPNFSVDSADRLVDIGINRRLWLVAECHGLDIKSDKSYKPLGQDFLAKHLSYIQARAKDVWVDTFHGVSSYLLMRKATQIERKDIAKGQAQIVLHSTSAGNVLEIPLTVVLKIKEKDAGHVVATVAGGRLLKAWACGENEACVDVDVLGQPVRVAWENAGP